LESKGKTALWLEARVIYDIDPMMVGTMTGTIKGHDRNWEKKIHRVMSASKNIAPFVLVGNPKSRNTRWAGHRVR
jgi:hypothetical protein